MKKICTKCRILKSIDLFHSHRLTPDGKNSWCRDCQREYNRQTLAKKRAEFFAGKSCAWTLPNGSMCESLERLELDHIDASKKTSHRIWSWSKERRESELAKCQVLCHDHHLVKTNLNNERPRFFGETHGMAKVTEKDVISMRTEYMSGGITQKELGKRYGITTNHVWYIVTRRSWKHVK